MKILAVVQSNADCKNCASLLILRSALMGATDRAPGPRPSIPELSAQVLQLLYSPFLKRSISRRSRLVGLLRKENGSGSALSWAAIAVRRSRLASLSR